MTAKTTIRINFDALPREFDRSRTDIVAEVIQTALREERIMADASDGTAQLRIDLPTVQLAKACAVLVDLKLI
ncbi:hypothetical protein [Roseinatronobacter sp.]|uniref:hypothetical protein n=1 Tax=Roseinatronobacter sp. TaxID=1945755 RepID=UPI0025E410FA|nr:hypothetical protein [Roseibaca sp.]